MVATKPSDSWFGVAGRVRQLTLFSLISVLLDFLWFEVKLTRLS